MKKVKKNSIVLTGKNSMVMEQRKSNLTMLGAHSKHEIHALQKIFSNKSSTSTLDTTFRNSNISNHENKRKKVLSNTRLNDTQNKSREVSINGPSLKKDRNIIGSKLIKPTESLKKKVIKRACTSVKSDYQSSSASKNKLTKKKLNFYKYHNKYLSKSSARKVKKCHPKSVSMDLKASTEKEKFKYLMPKISPSPIRVSVDLRDQTLKDKISQIKHLFEKFRSKAQSENLSSECSTLTEPKQLNKIQVWSLRDHCKYAQGIGMIKSTLSLIQRRELRHCFHTLRSLA
ncbi:unnamed protein product [Moneuplotes crassus]|uniref:Uncharacterized protein n=1 Tax=Euplotes crassus TaxID=5936 RepID=A0AAD1UMM5_EUPCR|nr:unnamed protein product [Moneuplotes crassus]